MNRAVLILLFVFLAFVEINAQKRANYFGRKFIIGWEHPIRPLSSGSASSSELTNLNFGWGKIKIEKLTTYNHSIGLCFEKNQYVIHDGFNSYQQGTLPDRYLTSRTYTFFLKGYNRNKGIAPIGNYSVFNFMFINNAVANNAGDKVKPTFGCVAIGYDIGRSFPIFGNRLIGDISFGISVRLSNTGNYQDLTNGNMMSNTDINQKLANINLLKFSFGISYALF